MAGNSVGVQCGKYVIMCNTVILSVCVCVRVICVGKVLCVAFSLQYKRQRQVYIVLCTNFSKV